MFSIINVPAVITIQPFAHLDRVMYALCSNGEQLMTFDHKETAVMLAQLVFGGV